MPTSACRPFLPVRVSARSLPAVWRQSKCIIEFAIREQPCIRCDDRSAKLKHDTTVESGSENAVLSFTRRVRRFQRHIINANHLLSITKSPQACSNFTRSSGECGLKAIKRIHIKSCTYYGQPRICRDLKDEGIFTSSKRVARLMRFAGIKGKKRCKSRASNYPPGTIPAAPNVLNRQFAVSQPNRTWVTDITYFPTKEGWLYLSVVLDCYSRRVVGWSMDSRIDAALALRALKMALRNRPYTDLILHSDRGSQFACRDYAQFLVNCRITASMSRKGNCWDNAVAESFFASIKVEIKPENVWSTRAEARTAIFDYIETWYNPQRRHSTNGYLSPVAYENRSVI